jgi:hypothetical protein
MKNIYLYLKWFLLLLCSFFSVKIILFIYEITAPYPITEIKRVSNLNHSVDAILATREVGATDNTPTLVYILPKNKVLNTNLDPILTATDVDNIKLIWESDNQLIIKVNSAIIHSFYGYTYSEINKNNNKPIYIKLDIDTYYKQ